MNELCNIFYELYLLPCQVYCYVKNRCFMLLNILQANIAGIIQHLVVHPNAQVHRVPKNVKIASNDENKNIK